jgi:hypothetical protein
MVVPRQDVSAMTFATTEVGFGLGGPFGTTYPLTTIDGGRTWRVAAQAFSRPTADAALGVDDISTASHTEAFAYGGPGGGSTIAVTTDGGTQHEGFRFPAATTRWHRVLLSVMNYPLQIENHDDKSRWWMVVQ